jgi:hypothetical protein
VYKDACLVCPEVQVQAYDIDLTKMFANLRRSEEIEVNLEMSYEIDAAFGVGTLVVNALTGRRIRYSHGV